MCVGRVHISQLVKNPRVKIQYKNSVSYSNAFYRITINKDSY